MSKQTSKLKALQVIYRDNTEFISNESTIPWDDTVPRNTEGVEVLDVVITPEKEGSHTRYILVEAVVQAVEQDNTGDQVTVALFRDNGDAIAASCGEVNGQLQQFGGCPSAIPLRYMFESTGLGKFRLSLRAGINNGRININGATNSRRLGGALVSSITVTEFAA